MQPSWVSPIRKLESELSKLPKGEAAFCHLSPRSTDGKTLLAKEVEGLYEKLGKETLFCSVF